MVSRITKNDLILNQAEKQEEPNLTRIALFGALEDVPKIETWAYKHRIWVLFFHFFYSSGGRAWS